MNALEKLEVELRRAVLTPPSPAEQTPSAPRRSRRRGGLAVALAALVVCGSATATVLSLTGEPSRPLAGTPPELGGASYRVELRPDLNAGAIGWCATVAIRGHASATAGSGCGPAAASGDTLIAAGALTGNGPGIAYAVVDQRTATVRFGRQRVVPRRDPALPPGWRAAVAIVRGESSIVPEDARGRPLAHSDRAGTHAAGTAPLPSHAVSPHHPPQHPCALHAPRLPELRAISARVSISHPPRPPDVNRRPFLSCASSVFYLHGRRLIAARLLDARHPEHSAALLPGMRTPPTRKEIVAAGDLITARRAGPGWIAVYGGTPELRATLLQALYAG
jgi:hypothetical protein